MAEITFSNSLIESLLIALMVVDGDLKIQFANQQFRSLFPPEVNLSPGTPITGILPDLIPHLIDTFETGNGKKVEKISCFGKELVAHISIIVSVESNHCTVVIMERAEDLERTAQKFPSFRKITTQLEAIFKSSHDGLWLLDATGKVLNINPAAEKIMGIRAKDVIGKNIDGLVKSKLLDDGVSPKVLKSKQPVNMIQYVTKTNKSILVTGTPVFDNNGEICMVVVNDRDMTELSKVNRKIVETQQLLRKNQDHLAEISMVELKEHQIVVQNNKMRNILITARKLGKVQASNILIQGESGTGKGLIAKFIHHTAEEKKRPFITINCAGIPETLLEAELFGYEKGAFTGANAGGKAGLIELAQSGTLFLDEIGELPYQVQAKLLKCIEDYEIWRIGGLHPIRINCVIIAATNRNMEKLVKKKIFRDDLFYRLNIFSIKVPPLRERPEDIFELSHLYLKQFNKKYGVKKKISSLGMDYLSTYRFPGNVRELKNLIQQGTVMSESEYLDDFIAISIGIQPKGVGFPLDIESKASFSLKEKLQCVEKAIIKNLYRQNLSTREMARHLGISQPSIINKLKRYKISNP